MYEYLCKKFPQNYTFTFIPSLSYALLRQNHLRFLKTKNTIDN